MCPVICGHGSLCLGVRYIRKLFYLMSNLQASRVAVYHYGDRHRDALLRCPLDLPLPGVPGMAQCPQQRILG